MDIARSRLVIGVPVTRDFRRQDGLGLTFILVMGGIFGGGVMASSNGIVECVLGIARLPWPWLLIIRFLGLMTGGTSFLLPSSIWKSTNESMKGNLGVGDIACCVGRDRFGLLVDLWGICFQYSGKIDRDFPVKASGFWIEMAVTVSSDLFFLLCIVSSCQNNDGKVTVTKEIVGTLI